MAMAPLARVGRRVVVFEREKCPRSHIGESLLPFSIKAFTRLGLHERFSRAEFEKKHEGAIMMRAPILQSRQGLRPCQKRNRWRRLEP